jgi:hypothetical protein
VRDELLSVLWLCGPPGAGKSAVGWALYEGLARSGPRVGFADIDQLGMCLPAPPDDPQRYRLKERNSQPEAALRLVAAESAAEAATLERSGVGDVRIDTDGRTAAEIADVVTGRW